MQDLILSLTRDSRNVLVFIHNEGSWARSRLRFNKSMGSYASVVLLPSVRWKRYKDMDSGAVRRWRPLENVSYKYLTYCRIMRAMLVFTRIVGSESIALLSSWRWCKWKRGSPCEVPARDLSGRAHVMWCASWEDSLTVDTWLILPVVICLSQRLSHACLSINNFILWNCRWLIKSEIIYLMVKNYMDTRSNSRANTCVNTFWWYLLDPNQPLWDFWWIMITVRMLRLCQGIVHSNFCPISYWR